MWLHHHSFLQTVKQSWELPIEGYGMYKLQQKLYRTKELLKKWNRETFGNVFSTVQQAKQAATDAEKNFDRDPSEANLIALNKSNAVMVHALTMEAEYWRQKSNCKWLEAGERNTKPDQRFSGNFENLLSGQGAQPSTTDFPFQFSKYQKQSEITSARFLQKRTSKRLCLVLTKIAWQARTDSHHHSIKHAGILLPEIYMMQFGISFSGTPMPRSFTATTIVLIPKADSPQTWNDFRPISLCNVTNKILSKLLYRRISQALPELISPSQSDDVIIFTNCKEDGLARLIQFLNRYENMSGQRINYAKSAFIPGKKASLIAQRIKITGFTMKTLPITYLGPPSTKTIFTGDCPNTARSRPNLRGMKFAINNQYSSSTNHFGRSCSSRISQSSLGGSSTTGYPLMRDSRKKGLHWLLNVSVVKIRKLSSSVSSQRPFLEAWGFFASKFQVNIPIPMTS
ncbi:UNVERIFIED_CONTAM: hypothetical protein Sradi_7130100 [Sesamum radiatum]|uniref:Reverse transcriptase domain-containing protein n=1 Tax=Sesamum radiatum TaxID=300843 RepID=A0AAW2IYA3_SESRA